MEIKVNSVDIIYVQYLGTSINEVLKIGSVIDLYNSIE